MKLKYDWRAISVFDWKSDPIIAFFIKHVPVDAIAIFSFLALGPTDLAGATSSPQFQFAICAESGGKYFVRGKFEGSDVPTQLFRWEPRLNTSEQE